MTTGVAKLQVVRYARMRRRHGVSWRHTASHGLARPSHGGDRLAILFGSLHSVKVSERHLAM